MWLGLAKVNPELFAEIRFIDLVPFFTAAARQGKAVVGGIS
jgi:hypothetical protein